MEFWLGLGATILLFGVIIYAMRQGSKVKTSNTDPDAQHGMGEG
jgi:hypothetical protein